MEKKCLIRRDTVTHDQHRPDPNVGGVAGAISGKKLGKSPRVDKTKEVKGEGSVVLGRGWADAVAECGRPVAEGFKCLAVCVGLAILVLAAMVVSVA